MKDWKESRAEARKFDDVLERGWARAFPGVERFERTPDGSDLQRAQVDRILHMRDGRTIQVEEKVRLNRAFEDDILLEVEHVHEDGRREPGWISRRADCEYYGFLFMPSQAFVVVPSQMLQAYWREQVANRKDNSRNFMFIEAKNRGYKTRCAIVPLSRLPCGGYELLEADSWSETI